MAQCQRSLALIAAIVLIIHQKSATARVLKGYCHAEDPDPYLYFSSNTQYRLIGGVINDTEIPDCQPAQIRVYSRHGTCYAKEKDLGKMLNFLPQLRDKIVENHEVRGSGDLCRKDLENLKNWTFDSSVSLEKAAHLTEQGELDLMTLAQRLQRSFPTLLNFDPISKNYAFRSTDTQRTKASMHSFMRGLFNNASAMRAEVVPSDEDYLLKIYDICPVWKNLSRSWWAQKEVDHFLNGPEYMKVVHDVSQRLGFSNDLAGDDLMLVYLMCGFEKAWYVDKLSPWCAVFDKKEMEVFEYEEDLYFYYYTNYGSMLNRVIGCPPIKDIYDHFTMLEKGATDQQRGVFRFMHSTGLGLLFTSLGIAEDPTPLKASNYKEMKNRKWRTSHLMPFGTNLVAVFYKCRIDDRMSHKVRLYLAEKPLHLDGCEGGLCDWQDLKERLRPAVENCNLDFCHCGK